MRSKSLKYFYTPSSLSGTVPSSFRFFA